MILDNEITIAGETVTKQRYGMASIHDENKTFTCLLYTSPSPRDS